MSRKTSIKPRQSIVDDPLVNKGYNKMYFEFILQKSHSRRIESCLMKDPNLDMEQVKVILQSFSMMDENGDGKISKREIARGYRMAGFNPTRDEIDEIIKEHDVNSDGYIDFDEYFNVMKSRLIQLDYEKERMKTAFKVLDTNQDGFISVDELRHALKYNGCSFTEDEIQDILKRADKNADGKIDYEDRGYVWQALMELVMFPGPFCKDVQLQSSSLRDNNVSPLRCGTIKNGLVLELQKFADRCKLSRTMVFSWIHQLQPELKQINTKTLATRITRTLETNKKLVSKKKVQTFESVSAFQSAPFLSETDFIKLTNHSNRSSECTLEKVLPCSSNILEGDGSQEQQTPVIESPNNEKEEDVTPTNEQELTKIRDERKKISNVLDYEIRRKQKMLRKLQDLTNFERETLNHMRSTKGHYSVRNVTKRDATAAENRKLLRQAQKTIIKQRNMIQNRSYSELEMKCNGKKCLLKYEARVQELLTENENLRQKITKLELKKSNAKKSARYFQRKAITEKLGVPENDQIKKLTKTLCEKKEEIQLLKQQAEEMEEKLTDKFETKSSNGSYNETVRLCVIELAGLEVAVDKIPKVIQVVAKQLFSRIMSDSDLPNKTTVQSIVDEGHFLAKSYIAAQLQESESFGLNRDGTTRKKQKILDTTITLDSGKVMSLGFTRVAHETAETINNVTKEHISELADLNIAEDKTINKNDYIRNSLQKLSFSMSDRASNEKKADRLLDEWRDEVLDNSDLSGGKQTVMHFHCMAHVLLGFHKYACDDLKILEKEFIEEKGPLGRDSLPLFKTWRTVGTILERVVRTTSDIFGPSGDHHGVRDRWEAYCSQKGLKSAIGNYQDNRFNGIFQTSAEILLHSKEFLEVLNTVKNPNRKLISVKADLQDDFIRTTLQCFGLFYIRLTGPYWNLVTSNAVPYLLLFTHIQDIVCFLKKCIDKPSTLLYTKGHWVSDDIHGVSDIQDRKRLENYLHNIESDNNLLSRIVKVVSAAMLRCIEKQLVDFLPGGQYSEEPSDKSLARTKYAHPTNLSCEHHFGDLDSSQKRRPNASMHHHSTVQLLKRNRRGLIEWISDLPPIKKHRIMKEARKGGRDLREMHLKREKNVISEIHSFMMTEKSKHVKKQGAQNDVDMDMMESELPTNDDFSENEYVIIAYQDSWYPGCVQKIRDELLTIKFLSPTRQPGYFVWPLRDDIQNVSKEFVLSKGFIPECVNSGRQWFIPDHVTINDMYKRYCKIYF